MSPRSTRFTGISGSRTVLSASSTFSCSSGSPASAGGRSTGSPSAPEGLGTKSKRSLPSSAIAAMALLRLHGGAEGAALDRSLESVPRERRAFDARGIGFDARQRLQPLAVLDERRRHFRDLAAGDL